MYENETYFDHTTCSEEELKQHTVPYDKKADKAAKKAAKAARKNEIKAAREAKRAEQVPGRKGGYGRKVVLSVSLGLCFGLFAGLGFYAVSLGTDRLAHHIEHLKLISAVGQSAHQSEALLHLAANLLFNKALVGREEMVELSLCVGAIGEDVGHGATLQSRTGL